MSTPTTTAPTAPTTTTAATEGLNAHTTPPIYAAPGWFTRNVFNRLVRRLTRSGVSLWGSRELRVRGRVSGEWRSVPVNLLDHEGAQYLVAARGTTHWVRNLRHAETGMLRLGRRTEPFTAREVPDADKEAILRAYLRRWKFEVGAFFDGVDHESSNAELRRIAPDHPVFRILDPALQDAGAL